MERFQPWREPTINPLFDSSPAALWDSYATDSFTQDTDMDLPSENNEAQYQDLSGLMHIKVVHGQFNENFNNDWKWAGSIKERCDLEQNCNAKPPKKFADKKGFETRSSQHIKRNSKNSNSPQKATHSGGQRLEREKSAGRSRESKCFVADVKQQEPGRKVRSREQSSSFGSPIALNLSNQSFSRLTVEELVREKVCLHQSKEDVMTVFNPQKSYSSTPQHKLHNHLPSPHNISMPPMYQRSRSRKKLEVEIPAKKASRSRKEARQQVEKIIADLLPREALACASKEAADDYFQSFALEDNGCGMPWHCSSIQKDRRKKLTEATGKSLACGLPVPTRRRGGKLGSGGKSESTFLKCFSERSLSSLDSESETTPLLTDPECYQCNSDAADPYMSSPQTISQKLEVNKLKECQGERRANHFISGNESNPKSAISLQARESVKDGENYRTLSQKYRPKSFKDLVGQTMVVQSLSNAVLKGRIAPVYLFQGPRGTGKTSTARIFTAALNCLSSEVPKPCNICSNCASFNSGHCSDIGEVDAAGNNSIESMQALLTHAALPSSISHHKVFIIDECHMLTMEAWNAFLKSLEEPPIHVVFILTTTEPEQLPRTALSRCQRFIFHKIKESEVLIRMQKLAMLENISIEADALQLIATRSDGSLRDAEMILDQLSLLGQSVTLQIVQELVGLVPDDKLMDLLKLSLSGDTVNTVRSIKMLTESGVEPLALMSQLATLITDVLGGNTTFGRDYKKGGLVSEHFVDKSELERLRQALQILSETEKHLKVCNDRTTWLTAALLQFAPSDCYTFSGSTGSGVTESPTASIDTCEKETVELVNSTAKQWWEEEEPTGQLQVVPIASVSENQDGVMKDLNHLFACRHGYSNKCRSIADNRVYPCEDLPTSAANIQDGISDNQNQTLLMLDNCSSLSGICLRKNGPMNLSEMDAVWRRVLESYCSNGLKELLGSQAKLVSLSLSEAFAVADLEFQHPEDKLKAERARTVIANAFKVALGCPVEISLSLAALQGSAVADSWSIILNRSSSKSKQCDIQPSNSDGRLSVSDLQHGLPKNHRDWHPEDSFDGTLKPVHIDSDALKNRESRVLSVGEISSWSSKDTKVEPGTWKKEEHLASQQKRNLDIISTELGNELARNRPHFVGRKIIAKDREHEVRPSIQVSNNISLAVVLQQADGSVDGYSQDLVYDDPNGLKKDKGKNDVGFSKSSECSENKDVFKFRNSASSPQAGFPCWKSTSQVDRKLKQQRLRRKRKARFILRLVPCIKAEL